MPESNLPDEPTMPQPVTVRTDIPPLGKIITTTIADTTHWAGLINLFKQLNIGARIEKGYITFTRAGKKVSDATIHSEIAKQFGAANSAPYSQAFSDILRAAWAIESAEVVDVDHAVIPEMVYDIIKPYVRWSTIQGGTKVNLVRTSEANTWEIAIDIWGALTQYKHPSGKNYLVYISDEVRRMQKSGEISWGVDSQTDSRTGVVTRTFTPFLSLAQQNTEGLQSDMRFFMDLPATFSNDPDVPASSFFPLNDLDDHLTGSCEHWLDFESQMPEWARYAWRATFYAAFDDKNRSRQMAILYDSGQTGKSNMFRAVAKKTAGGFYVPISKDSLGNQFWGSKIYGKRLVLFSDSGNTKISQMDKIKQLSGGDPIDVELKGINSQIRYVPNCRVWISTNRRPEINTYARHQLSRVLVFPLTATTDPKILKKFCLVDDAGELVLDKEGHPITIGASYDEFMAQEFYDYLHLCKTSYEELCPNGQDIIVPAEMTEYIKLACVSTGTDALDHLFSSYLQMKEGADITNTDLKLVVDHLVGEGKQPDLTYDDVITHILDMGGIRKRLKRNGRATRGFDGVGLRPGVSIVRDQVTLDKPDAAVPLPGMEDLD